MIICLSVLRPTIGVIVSIVGQTGWLLILSASLIATILIKSHFVKNRKPLVIQSGKGDTDMKEKSFAKSVISTISDFIPNLIASLLAAGPLA
jgi:hypothetical protein